MPYRACFRYDFAYAGVRPLDADLHCIRCGHNLRTLSWSANCGECGTPVEQSRVPAYLLVRDLLSLRWLRLALILLAMTWAIDAVVTVHFQTLVNYWIATVPPHDNFGFGEIQAFLSWCSVATRTGAACVLVLLALRVPNRRALIMLVVVIYLAVLSLLIVDYAVRWGILILFPPARTLRVNAGIAAGILDSLAPFSTFLWLSGILVAVGDARWRRTLRTGLVASGTSAALVFLAWLIPLSTLTGGYEVWSQWAYWMADALALLCAAICLLILRREFPRIGGRT
ncbi:MAG: hypothetical protein H6819_00260 [Phycisphaerales bacterium]|nr:hypothetical protein [Phycisphaerales bacterium]MCB9857359.1 hypothetical protein [Phycisphaerales bacterium]